MQRRELLKYLSAFPLAGGAANLSGQPAWASPFTPSAKRDIFKELGVRTFINAAGTYTAMTGSLMHDVVLEAIYDSSKDFCMMDELQDRAGEKIASLVHAEAAVVTSGAFAAMTLGLAGILTGMDLKKVEQLPHLEGTGMKSEVICQKAHEIVYNHALKNTGCKIIYIETIEELEKAINEKTALLHFLNIEADKGKIVHEEWVAIGRKHGIATSIDIAADVPPLSNLWKFNDMGFSFVAISGGKAIRGPQSAGLLMGKKEIIAAARLHMPPRGFNIGRGMKVNKEEVIGMYVALEKYINQDHDKEWKVWEAAVAHIESAVKQVKGVTTNITVPPLGNTTPTLEISWDNATVKLTGKDLQTRLRNATPSIEIGGVRDNSIVVTVWMLKPGQEKIVATRIKEELVKA
ncbi:aminotransferase class V-fold PLP-dependent enzyme [Pseudoflavitalea sp. X16]|uniref:aminotransferase class V-fold PLP-dependent enzyme n=1 Tax=Paraflavitalea devenefica TaxID=2716334 RepID=UPI00142225A1|nr:aminotransferase class V-fold PLP-dependent enzyme [Paraflavitalea devenefica]NII25188.1 aminotransferase class V-fold PLP-dependent enzyme [Paraflavitalea devenefica]